MKGILVLIALLIVGYTYVYINTALVLISNEPEALSRFWLANWAMYTWLFSALLIVPAHFWFVRSSVRKLEWDWSLGVPFFVMPYMLGVICQAMFL